MNYKFYDTEDFLQDSSFRSFCNGTCKESVEFWEEWISRHPEKMPQIEEAKHIYTLLNGGINAEIFRAHRLKMQHVLAESGIVLKEEAPVVKPLWWKKQGRTWHWLAAASVIGVIVITFLLNRSTDHTLRIENGQGLVYRSMPGEKKTIQLPDGTKVILNAGSTVQLAGNFNKGTRELKLEGEAYFDVVHNPEQPFIVHSKRFDVKVLGTAFNVRSYSNDTKSAAALVRGKIELSFPGIENRHHLILKPNQQVIVEDDAVVEINGKNSSAPVARTNKPSPIIITPLQLMPYDSSVIETCWTENKLVFYDEPFEDVAKKLERWFGVSIRFEQDAIKQFRYTGTFDKENLPSIIEALKLSKPFSYQFRENERLLILSK